MINLNTKKLDAFSNKYALYMVPKIKNKYLKLKSKFSILNPFTFKPFFDNSNIEQQIQYLLTGNIEQIILKYPNFKQYFNICEFVFYRDLAFEVDIDSKDFYNNKSEYLKEKKYKRKKYLEEYTDYTKKNNEWLRAYLTRNGSPLPLAIESIIVSDKEFSIFVNEIKNRLNDFNNEIINKIINYSSINEELRHTMLFHSGVEVCPYCNRNYISKYKKNGSLKRSTADLDHFYPKSIFALFSLSLYNFVPSCQICNSRFKLAKGRKIINPYSERIDYSKFKFVYKLNNESTPEIFFNETYKFSISILCEDEKYKNNVQLFELENLYNTHKSYVSELIYIKEAYNNSYKDLFNKIFIYSMKLTEEDINTFLYGFNMKEEDFFKKPLSKLTYDIVKGN